MENKVFDIIDARCNHEEDRTCSFMCSTVWYVFAFVRRLYKINPRQTSCLCPPTSSPVLLNVVCYLWTRFNVPTMLPAGSIVSALYHKL